MFTKIPDMHILSYTHGTIWEERGTVTAKNKQVKRGLSILNFLEAVQFKKNYGSDSS